MNNEQKDGWLTTVDKRVEDGWPTRKMGGYLRKYAAHGARSGHKQLVYYRLRLTLRKGRTFRELLQRGISRALPVIHRYLHEF